MTGEPPVRPYGMGYNKCDVCRTTKTEGLMNQPDSPKPQRRSIRVPGYDYRQGLFFVTICTYQRQRLFGEVVANKMVLSALGEIVADEWRKTAVIRANVSLDRFVVMPNHFHAVIELNADDEVGANRWFAQVQADKRSISLQKDSLGAVMAQFKSVVVKRYRQRFADESGPVWQRGYYERIIRNERELNAIRQYIENNVSRWAEDRDNLDALVVRMIGR
jgi:putative transposase